MYADRIKAVVESEEKKNARALKVDVESAGRILKRSLWSHAVKNSNQNQTTVESPPVNSSAVESIAVNKRTKFDD